MSKDFLIPRRSFLKVAVLGLAAAPLVLRPEPVEAGTSAQPGIYPGDYSILDQGQIDRALTHIPGINLLETAIVATVVADQILRHIADRCKQGNKAHNERAVEAISTAVSDFEKFASHITDIAVKYAVDGTIQCVLALVEITQGKPVLIAVNDPSQLRSGAEPGSAWRNNDGWKKIVERKALTPTTTEADKGAAQQKLKDFLNSEYPNPCLPTLNTPQPAFNLPPIQVSVPEAPPINLTTLAVGALALIAVKLGLTKRLI